MEQGVAGELERRVPHPQGGRKEGLLLAQAPRQPPKKWCYPYLPRSLRLLALLLMLM